jgi:tetratricopeptide (TPR) repeat protein
MNEMRNLTRAVAACLLAVALSATALSATALAADPPTYTMDTDPLRLAAKAIEAGAFAEARSHFEEAVAAGYRLADAHTGLATVAVREGRYAEAEAQYRQAIDAAGGRAAEAHAGLGVVLLRQEQTEAAAAEFTAALAIDDDNWLAHYGRARLHIARGAWPEARTELERGRARHGVTAGEDLYHHGRALLLLGAGDTIEAEKAALLAVSLNPQDPDHGALLARIYTQRGVPALAIQAYEQALSAPGVQPTATMLHQLGNLYRGQQRFNEARDQYLRAVALDSTYVPVFGDLADLLRRAGRHEMAARTYLRYVADAPADTSAWLGLAGSLTELRRYDQACDAAAHARQLDPTGAEAQRAFVRAGLHATDPAVKAEAADLMASLLDDGTAWTAAELLDLAAVQMERKTYDAAVVTLARAAAADSTLYQVPFQQGVLALRTGQPQAAVASFERAVTLAPESAPVQLNLGIAHYQAGQVPEAIAALRAAVERDPSSTTARGMLAQTLRGVGFSCLRAADYQGAVKAYTEAANVEPNDADGWAGLGNAQLGLGNLDTAESAFARARSLDPRNVMLQKGTELLNQARSARKENQPR